MTIRYYYLSGRATKIVDGAELTLSMTDFHDFILNKKDKMKFVYKSENFKYCEYVE